MSLSVTQRQMCFFYVFLIEFLDILCLVSWVTEFNILCLLCKWTEVEYRIGTILVSFVGVSELYSTPKKQEISRINIFVAVDFNI